MRGVEGCWAGRGEDVWTDAGTEEVVETWGGWGSDGLVGEMGMCGVMVIGWDDAERLW